MCRRRFTTVFLLLAPWLTSPASAQVSRSAQMVAPRAVPTVAPTSVGTATLPALDQIALPPGAKGFVETSVPSSLTDGPTSGLLYQREQRDGRAVLVETTYKPVKGSFGPAKLKATGEWLYPGDTKLVYTGPWVKGVYGFGLKKVTLEGFAAYILRPLDVGGRRVMPRVGITSVAMVTAGTTEPPKSGARAKAPVMVLATPQPVGQDAA
jgi:hypothetical protein